MPDTMATGWARGLPHAILDGVRVRPTVFRAPGEARGLGDFSVSAVSRQHCGSAVIDLRAECRITYPVDGICY